MRVIVTGATSFIGSHAVVRLLQDGHEVYAVVRPGSPRSDALKGLVEGAGLLDGMYHQVDLDMGELDRLPELLDGGPFEGWLHAAWAGPGSENRKRREVQQQNVLDSMKGLEAASRLGCRRFLFTGSQAEYGICSGPMREADACHPVSEYGKAKIDFCQAAMGFAQGRIDYLHARIFSVYGPGDHPGSLVESCIKACLEDGELLLGPCTQRWNYLHIEDLTQALCRLLFHPGTAPGIYNVAGLPSDTRPLREYVEDIREACGGGGRLFFGQRPPHAEGMANLIPDISKICEATGWRPEVPFKEGIREMARRRISLIAERGMCLACGAGLEGEPLMELDGLPASAQDIPDALQVKDDRGIKLSLCQCHECGLVQFDCEPVAYYRDVIRAGGGSTTMVELREGQYRHLIETYGLHGKKLVEVGCGQGEFLKVLAQFPVQAYGIEHRADLVEKARQDGLEVRRGFAEDGEVHLEDGPFDGFLSFNFLEHQPMPGAMLDCIHANLTADAVGLITVPSFEYILENDGYYELIRDHLAYYTFDTIGELLAGHGFRVLEQEMVNRDTLSVVVRKVDASAQRPSRRHSPADVSGLEASYRYIREEVRELVESCRRQGRRLAVWGASHQGFTLAATTALKDGAAYIIDSAPFKQGRFAPSSHLPIISPEDAALDMADCILIVAPGYTREIAGAIRERFGDGVKIYTLRSNHIEVLDL